MNSKEIQLILASQSPRRKQLLTQNGYQFQVIAPDDSVEQGVCSECSPADFVMQAAYLKAQAIASKVETGIILAADTVAECKAQILGKPVDREHAERMLRMMSGQHHRVLTGVCLWHQPSGKYVAHLDVTTLKMDELVEVDLQSYLDSDDWIGKAGAFGYQDGLDWVHIENGLESTVVGLPVEHLPQLMEDLLTKIDLTT